MNAINPQLVAHDFVTRNHGVLSREKLNIAEKALVTTKTSFAAKGSIASMIFYMKCQCTVDGGKTFDGNAGGVSSPGGGALFGDVYTDDLDKLYAATKSFELNGTPVYTSFLFFDGNSNLLGHFQAGAVSTVLGVAGGSGGWS